MKNQPYRIVGQESTGQQPRAGGLAGERRTTADSAGRSPVVLRDEAPNLDAIPYDVLQAGRRLSFSLGDLFPHLSGPVVGALDRGDLDALHAAQGALQPIAHSRGQEVAASWALAGVEIDPKADRAEVMPGTTRRIIGFDRKIRLSWLDATAEWTLQGPSPAEIRAQLERLLDGQVYGSGSHSARGRP